MLSFAAFVPSTPLLIPAIGREHQERMKKTLAAMATLQERLLASSPTSIFVIAYPETLKETFKINLAGNYQAHLQAFGDFSTRLIRQGDAVEASQIKENVEQKIPLSPIDDPALAHTFVVPLLALTGALPDIPVLPISVSSLPLKDHYELGKLLQEHIGKTNKRVALIASGDLSHTLTPDAPGGFSLKGTEFDTSIVSALTSNNPVAILNLSLSLLEEVQESGVRSLSVLLGTLDKINYNLEILSYEGPLGVGHLVANFKL